MKPSRKARLIAGGKNYDGFSLPPHACYVIGVDTQHGPEHPLYKQRAVDLYAGRVAFSDRMLRSIRTHGVKVPIIVVLHSVRADDEAWPVRLRGHLVHVVVAGRHRVLYGRRIVDEMDAAGTIKDRTSWQIKCSLHTSRQDRDSFEVSVDENVCRRQLDDDELGEEILQGLNVGLTIDEMADRLGLSLARAKRLQRRAEGVPEKPKEKRPRVPASAIRKAIEHLNEEPAVHGFSNRDVAELLQCIRGEVPISAATRVVRVLLGAEGA